jgi:DNA-binding response OmpR family regulator
MNDLDAVIVDLDQHSQALSTIEGLGCTENKPPVIVLTNSKMAPVAYHHGATVCVIKPFSARELASIISNVCSHAHPFGPEHPIKRFPSQHPKLHFASHPNESPALP